MDERTGSAMLAGTHAAYELKENIMSTGMRVRSERRTSKVHARVSTGRLGFKACLLGGVQGESRELVAS